MLWWCVLLCRCCEDFLLSLSHYRLRGGSVWSVISHSTFNVIVINPRRMRRRVTVLGLCVCVCQFTSSAIAPNKTPRKGHHMNQRPMRKIFKKAVFKING